MESQGAGDMMNFRLVPTVGSVWQRRLGRRSIIFQSDHGDFLSPANFQKQFQFILVITCKPSRDCRPVRPSINERLALNR